MDKLITYIRHRVEFDFIPRLEDLCLDDDKLTYTDNILKFNDITIIDLSNSDFLSDGEIIYAIVYDGLFNYISLKIKNMYAFRHMPTIMPNRNKSYAFTIPNKVIELGGKYMDLEIKRDEDLITDEQSDNPVCIYLKLKEPYETDSKVHELADVTDNITKVFENTDDTHIGRKRSGWQHSKLFKTDIYDKPKRENSKKKMKRNFKD